MKVRQLTVLSALLLCIATVHAAVCSTRWQNQNQTCPSDSTVCAMVRTGTTYQGCTGDGIYHKCMCANNQVCPTDNDDHRLYRSQNTKLYTCGTSCSIDWCGRFGYAEKTYQNSENFGGDSYTEINCRCQQHHYPKQVSSTMFSGTTNGVRKYDCRRSKRGEEDPCSE